FLTRRATSATMPRHDSGRIVAARSLRGFADGCVSVLLAGYLTHLGFSPFEVGCIVTGTLFGSAALTLAAGLLSHRLDARRVLLGASGLMIATGLGFFTLQSFVALLIVAVLGTLNPSAGDVTLFLPTEQTLLAAEAQGAARASAFARYNF